MTARPCIVPLVSRKCILNAGTERTDLRDEANIERRS